MLGAKAFEPEYGSPEYVSVRKQKLEMMAKDFWDGFFNKHGEYDPGWVCFSCGKTINRKTDNYFYFELCGGIVFRVHAEREGEVEKTDAT